VISVQAVCVRKSVKSKGISYDYKGADFAGTINFRLEEPRSGIILEHTLA
jgi:hypothetical protein